MRETEITITSSDYLPGKVLEEIVSVVGLKAPGVLKLNYTVHPENGGAITPVRGAGRRTWTPEQRAAQSEMMRKRNLARKGKAQKEATAISHQLNAAAAPAL